LKFLSFIADPNLAYLLMMLAALGIYLEFSNPGLILPGVAGSIAGILAMMSFQMLPINTAGIVLLLVGLILIGLEFFVAGSGKVICLGCRKGGMRCLTASNLLNITCREVYTKR